MNRDVAMQVQHAEVHRFPGGLDPIPGGWKASVADRNSRRWMPGQDPDRPIRP
jgi:hypothetical protein